MMTKKEQSAVISCRVSKRFADLLKKCCANAYLNPADFLRDAVREKVQKEAPELYEHLFKETSES